jgi:hypothetical protein
MTGIARKRLAKAAVALALLATVAAAEDFLTHPPGFLKDNHGKGTADYSSYAPGIRFPIIDFPSRLNSQVRGLGSGALGGDQCDASNYDNTWWDTLCETRKRKDSIPLGCPLDTVHQGVDIRGGTTETCRKLVSARQNLIPVVAVTDGTIQSISTYTVDLSPGSGERFRYLHMNMQGLKVKVGDKVTKGQVIGFMYKDFGDTPTTFHLHFEHWKNISGKGFIPVPVYCDLIVAYERDRGVKSTMIGGGQLCEGSNAAGATPIAPPPMTANGTVANFASYWTSGDSEVGLVAVGASRSFVYTVPAPALAQIVRPGDVLFEGRKEGDRYVGRARVLDDACGDEPFEVSGPVTAGGQRVEVSGSRIRQGATCGQPGAQLVTLRFDFVRQQGEAPTGTTGVAAQTCGPVLDRQQKTELTRNWGAITMFVPWENWSAYIKLWPGLKVGADGRPVDVQIDRLGGSIMAFESDESGIGIWYYWLLVRKGFGKDGVPTASPTINQIARGIAGETATAAAVATYVNAYTTLSERYFGRRLGPDEPITIAAPDQLWALGQTMFHHESGRTPLIDRATFDRGVRFGTDFMAGTFSDKDAYLLTCDTEPTTDGQSVVAVSASADKDRQIADLQETNARLLAMISDLQSKLEEIAKLAVQ